MTGRRKPLGGRHQTRGRRPGVARLACSAGLALALSAGAPAHAAESCAAGLATAPPAAQLECLKALRDGETPARADLHRVIDLLGASDAAIDHRVVAAGLDVVRRAGAARRDDLDRPGAPAAEVLSALLPYRSPLHRDRDKMQVVRLRAYLVVTLAEIGFPRSALPALVDTLAHVDETMPPLELTAAAHAVRALGADGRAFVPYLLETLHVRNGSHEVSLERYDPVYPRSEATTLQLEAMRSLARVATAGDPEVAEVLRGIVRDVTGQHDPRLIQEARAALAEIAARPAAGERPSIASLTGDAAEATPAPRRLENLDVAYVDQDGRTGVLADLVDRPTLVTFFYTRCQNGKKCPMTIARLAALQRKLDEAGLAGRVRLLAVTYEPQIDGPQRLARHTSARGLDLGDGVLALQLDSARQDALLAELGIEVSYNAGWVNAHGVQLTLLGAGGELVAAYRDVAWRTEAVLEGVREELARRRPAEAAPQAAIPR